MENMHTKKSSTFIEMLRVRTLESYTLKFPRDYAPPRKMDERQINLRRAPKYIFEKLKTPLEVIVWGNQLGTN